MKAMASHNQCIKRKVGFASRMLGATLRAFSGLKEQSLTRHTRVQRGAPEGVRGWNGVLTVRELVCWAKSMLRLVAGTGVEQKAGG